MMYMEQLINSLDHLTADQLKRVADESNKRRFEKYKEQYESTQIDICEWFKGLGVEGFGLLIENELTHRVVLSPSSLVNNRFVVLTYHNMDEKRKKYLNIKGED